MDSQGVPSFSLGCRGRLGFPLAALRLSRFLRRERVDIMHGHLFEPGLVGLVAGTLARDPESSPDSPLLGLPHPHTQAAGMYGLTGSALRSATGWWLSHGTRLSTFWRWRERRPPRSVSYTTASTSTASNPPVPRREPASELPRAWRTPMSSWLRHGSIQRRGTSISLTPSESSRRSHRHPFVLLVAGEGPFEGEYRERTRRLGCEGLVRFMGFRNDLPDLMVASDVFVLPSVAEAFGLVLVEALYLGVPVVATRVGGIPEIVDHGVDGILVPPADSTALAEALAELLLDPMSRARLAGRVGPRSSSVSLRAHGSRIRSSCTTNSIAPSPEGTLIFDTTDLSA